MRGSDERESRIVTYPIGDNTIPLSISMRACDPRNLSIATTSE